VVKRFIYSAAWVSVGMAGIIVFIVMVITVHHHSSPPVEPTDDVIVDVGPPPHPVHYVMPRVRTQYV